MRTYKQFTQGERYHIGAMLAAKKSSAEIAEALRRVPSTISRELRRNKSLRGYRPGPAQRLAESRRTAKSSRRLSEALWKEIETLLRKAWSPEQIAGRENDELIVMCHHGVRSARVCGFLLQAGFTRPRSLVGGIDAWSLAVDPAVARY